jgi:hypothetical protein
MRFPIPRNRSWISCRAKHAWRPVARIGIAGKALLGAAAIVVKDVRFSFSFLSFPLLPFHFLRR